jgi:hypothetical protein
MPSKIIQFEVVNMDGRMRIIVLDDMGGLWVKDNAYMGVASKWTAISLTNATPAQ